MPNFIFDVVEESDEYKKRGFVDLVDKSIFIYDDIKGEILFKIKENTAIQNDEDAIAYSIALG